MCRVTNKDRKRERFWICFQTGKLQWGFHGLLGVLCVITTELCRRTVNSKDKLHSKEASLLLANQVINFLLSYKANNLLGQVPSFTQIIPGVVAPHKEAFRRTIGSMHYLIARVLCKLAANQLQFVRAYPQVEFYVSLMVLLCQWWPLVPGWNMAVFNGNTWIFVIPIFIGVTGDIWQFCYGDMISISQLLQVQLTGLLLAFGFTLAFRNYVPMPVVYAIAAAAVWDLLHQGYQTVIAH